MKKEDVAKKMKRDPRMQAAKDMHKLTKAAGRAAKVVKLNDKGLPF